jgi:hypothetical protein
MSSDTPQYKEGLLYITLLLLLCFWEENVLRSTDSIYIKFVTYNLTIKAK